MLEGGKMCYLEYVLLGVKWLLLGRGLTLGGEVRGPICYRGGGLLGLGGGRVKVRNVCDGGDTFN